MIRFWLSLCVMLVAIVPAHADPDGGEIVGTLNGKSYRYDDVKPDRMHREGIKKYSKGEKVDIRLRNHAAVDFRHIALPESLKTMMPNCDLNVTQDEIEQFTKWWQSSSRDLLSKLVADAESRNPGIKVRLSGGWKHLDEINAGNEKVTEAAREKIETWKANLCLFKAYGGGRVRKDLGPYKFMQKGETVVAAYDSLAGYPYPVIVTVGTPLNAYIKHFDKAQEVGVLSIPDQRYEDGFYLMLRNDKLDFFADPEEEASIITRYWTQPVFVPTPDEAL